MTGKRKDLQANRYTNATWDEKSTMPKIRLGKLNWVDLAMQAVPPVLKAAGLVWAKHRQKKADRENVHQANEIEALNRCLREKDTEMAHLQSQLVACEEKLAQAHHTIEHLQQELAAERSKPWWEKAVSWLRDQMGFRAH